MMLFTVMYVGMNGGAIDAFQTIDLQCHARMECGSSVSILGDCSKVLLCVGGDRWMAPVRGGGKSFEADKLL